VKLEELQTPALLVRLDRVRANLRRMRELLAGRGGMERWRPHTKTAKVPRCCSS
jgi:D-serine deaminase-like pyridoxal phosphate-dependent protein